MVLCRSPTLWGVKSASGRTVKMRRWRNRGKRETGGLTETGGASVLAEDERRVEQRAVWLLAGGIDVQLALEDVVDDRLGQVIHDMAVPMLQG